MGNSLYNKIYLGRRTSVLSSKRTQALFIFGAAALAGAFWLYLRSHR